MKVTQKFSRKPFFIVEEKDAIKLCNFADNYYGDQICKIVRIDKKSQKLA